MLNRRSFLGAGAAALLAHRLRGAASCTADQIDVMIQGFAGFRAPKPSLSFSKPAPGTPARRPLWSNLMQDDTSQAHYLQTLSKAYTAMKNLKLKDRKSLDFQVWLHWRWCQLSASDNIHGNSGFLPWHRALLYYYERLIQVMACAPDFRLAAWDWEVMGTSASQVNRAKVPPIYNDSALLPGCGSRMNDRVTPVDPVSSAAITGWLQPTTSPQTSQTFLGRGEDGYSGNAVSGPHDHVHTSLGGIMGVIDLAAYDPVFFAHHANVDRFFDFWTRRYGSQPGFWNGQTWPASSPWTFYDAKSDKFVSVRAEDMLHLESLDYCYDQPRIYLFEFTSLSKLPGNVIRFPPEDIENFFNSAWGALKSAAAELPHLMAALRHCRLPVIARLTSPQPAAIGSYQLSLRSDDVHVPLGGFSILHSHHNTGPIRAFLSLGSEHYELLASAAQKGLALECKPALDLSIESFEIHYPLSPSEWSAFLKSVEDSK